MATPITSIDSQHEDMIHDCQFDYYSKKLATCSSDRTIKIFDVSGDIYHNSATLTGHEGPVWQVAWAHPKFGPVLASCSYDGTVAIHKEVSQNNWIKVYDHKFHDSSVNSISWASHEFGLMLACASSDGRVSILEHKNGIWNEVSFLNDALGCNAVSWAPYNPTASHSEDGAFIHRLVTGSCDNMVRVWKRVESGIAVPTALGSSTTSSSATASGWIEEAKTCLTPHSDWVRDVAWAPSSSVPYSTFASCSEDRSVYIWKQTEHGWEPSLLRAFDAPVWRVSWSITGNVLAVSTGDHKVTLWKQSVDETWVQISSVEEGE
mmetsp:Transcript_21142/g.35824  ORF Transcript_21142/g.35824 Transcript_21142/m.35824 type:complete len:320 (-) Transcript_21142:151-1110(-)